MDKNNSLTRRFFHRSPALRRATPQSTPQYRTTRLSASVLVLPWARDPQPALFLDPSNRKRFRAGVERRGGESAMEYRRVKDQVNPVSRLATAKDLKPREEFIRFDEPLRPI